MIMYLQETCLSTAYVVRCQVRSVDTVLRYTPFPHAQEGDRRLGPVGYSVKVAR
jgi:hypothetical protein